MTVTALRPLGIVLNPLFVSACRILYTWDWDSEKELRARIKANPHPRQRAWIITKAMLIMMLQLTLWTLVISALIVYPIHLIKIGRGGFWLASSPCLGVLLILYSVLQLWIYTRRYMNDFTPQGHIKFLQMWPDWVRYVLPGAPDTNMPRTSVVHIVVIGALVWGSQYWTQDWDLQRLTQVEQRCSVERRQPIHTGASFSLRVELLCGGVRHTVEGAEIAELVWNRTDPVQCLTYEGGILSCRRM